MQSSQIIRRAAFLAAMAAASSAMAETVINANWLGLANNYSDVWSNPVRWNPQQVPNNFGNTVYDVTITGGDGANIGPSLQSGVTLRNLSLLNGGQMSNNTGVPADLTVTGTTTMEPYYYNTDAIYGGMEVRVSTYTLGNFANADDGILVGGVYRIEGSYSYRPAVLRWKNADLLENAAELSLFGDTRLEDQDTGQDALRHFAVNSGILELNGKRQLTTGSFTNTGTINVIGGEPDPATSSKMTVNGNFTNGGTLDLNRSTFTVTGNMINGGNIKLDGPDAKLVVNGSITQTSGTLQLGEVETFRMTAARIDMAAGTTLGGMGTMFCDLVGRGVLSPGNSPGRITVNGKVTMDTTTQSQFELGGSVAGTGYDQIVQTAAVAGDSTTLAGELQLSTLYGYVPAYGTSHRLIAAALLGSGRFAKVTGHKLSADRWLAVTYDATGVSVTAALPGDATVNGTVNFDDLIPLAQNYNKPTLQTWATGDFTGDGKVNFDDLIPLAQHYNGHVTAGALTSLGGETFASDWALAQSLVPEPTTMVALGAGSLIGNRRRRVTSR